MNIFKKIRNFFTIEFPDTTPEKYYSSKDNTWYYLDPDNTQKVKILGIKFKNQNYKYLKKEEYIKKYGEEEFEKKFGKNS